MSGIDIYKLSNGIVNFIGHIPVSGPNRDSVIKQLTIEKKDEKYRFSFSGHIEYLVNPDIIIKGSRLIALYENNRLKEILK